MLRRKRLLLIAAAIVLIPIAAVAWWLGSPLFISKTVQEEFPLSARALVPSDMTHAEVEKIMAGAAGTERKVNEPISDETALQKAPPGPIGDARPGLAVTPTTGAKLKSGSFRDADRFHKGSGRATIYRAPDGSHLLRLEEFQVTNGPELHVILAPHPNPESRSDVTAAGYIDLGKLKGNIGDQNYAVPANVDLTGVGSIVIYCKPFHVIFSVATLQRVS